MYEEALQVGITLLGAQEGNKRVYKSGTQTMSWLFQRGMNTIKCCFVMHWTWHVLVTCPLYLFCNCRRRESRSQSSFSEMNLPN